MIKFVRKIFGAQRYSGGHPRDPALVDLFRLPTTASGQYVTPDTAMQVSAVYACVRLISESLASLPLFLYRRGKNGGKFPAWDSPLYEVIHDQPNRYQTSFEFREMMQAHVLLRGNAYAYKDRSDGRLSLIPLHPDRVTPFKAPDGKVAFAYQPPDGELTVFLADEIFRVHGLSMDGLTGLNPIELQRETIGSAAAAAEYGARFFANDATPRGVIIHPSHFASKEDLERFREAWQRAYSGENRHKVAVLEDGLSYKEISISNKDSQFLESRQFSVTEIARMFRVPPHMIADLSRSTFSNIEQQSLEFVVYTLRPWLVRWEQAIRRDILTPQMRKQFFAQFVVEGLLRGDIETRFKAYATARQWGWMSVNDIRRRENMNPIRGGDEFLRPLNMQPVGGPAQQAQALLRSAAERVARKEAKAAAKMDREHHVQYVQRVLAVDDELAARLTEMLDGEVPPFDDAWIQRRTEQIIEEVMDHAIS